MSEYKPYRIGFTSNSRTVTITFKLSTENDWELHDYLKPIVHMWARGIEMKPLSTKNQSNEAILQNALDNIDARLSSIESQIVNGQVVILRKE